MIALALAIVLRTFFIQAYKIPSGSMEPTLLVGDHIIVNKLVYGLRLPDSFFGLTPFADEIPWGHYLFHLRARSIAATWWCSFFHRIRPRISSSG